MVRDRIFGLSSWSGDRIFGEIVVVVVVVVVVQVIGLLPIKIQGRPIT